MLTIHHLNNSRSQRVLWLLEELGVEYAIKNYQRDGETNLAPPELIEVHPLGKSPVLTDGDLTIIESGAIIDYIVRHYGEGKLAPEAGTNAYEEYLQWMHYAEGSAMLPLMLKLYTSRLPDQGEALQPRIHSEIDNHLGFMNRALTNSDWFVNNTFSAADIQLSFVPQVGKLMYGLDNFPHLDDFLTRIHARPAYQRAVERGGTLRLRQLIPLEITERQRQTAAAPILPLLRVQALSHLPAWAFGLLCGGAMFSLLIVPVLVLEMSTVGALEILGNALFFGLSVSIVAGATGSVIKGAERDLLQIRGVVDLSDEQFECLTRCLSRQKTSTSLLLLTLGFLFGGLHNYLLGQYQNIMPFLVTQTTATFFMWVIMMAVLPKITENALIFSRLGSAAKPDLLRPSRHAAFGAAALRPAVFLIGTICMYGFLLLGDNNPFDQGVWIGIAASFVTLVGIVIFPLMGIRVRIRETRQESLAALDARIESLDIGDVANASVKVMDEMDTVLDMRERVARAPGWPLDLAGVRRILLYIVLPPLTWAAAAIVEMLIDSAL